MDKSEGRIEKELRAERAASESPSVGIRRAVWVGILTWLMVTGCGMAGLLFYSITPGKDAAPPLKWPESSQLARGRGRETLVMFAHPNCPCTRASISELAELLGPNGGELSVCVSFIKPRGTGEDWMEPGLMEMARDIPGVVVAIDVDGAESERFRVETSGTVVLYDAEGTLRFHGGITAARGHTGENAGMLALEAAIRVGRVGAVVETPVFGCPLHGECEKNGESRCR